MKRKKKHFVQMKTTLARSMLSVYLGQESIRFASSK